MEEPMTAPDPPKDKKAVSFEKEQDEREEDVVVESQESGDPLLDPVPNGKPENDDSSIDEKERPSEADEENARIAFLLKQSGESVSVRDGGAFNDTKFTSLPEDTFSFVISSKPLSFPFVTALGVYALKTLIFYLVLVNLISGDVNFNKVGVPVSVDTAVVISQFLAFAISVMTQQDLVSAMILVYLGYSPEMLEVFGRDGHGGGRFAQWAFAIFCAFSDGLFGLAVTFLLIVTSSTVLDVLLNFAAVEFVSGLDDAAFYLAQKGFLGRLNKIETDIVGEGTYQVPRMRRKKGAARLRTIGLMTVLAVVIAMWAYLYWLQLSGHYNPKTIIIQFGDQFQPFLGAYSGFYSLKTGFGKPPSTRFRYSEERNGGGQFGYCARQAVWTFYIGGNDPCNIQNVLVQSDVARTFDLTQLIGATWFVKRPTSDNFVPMQNFFMDLGCLQDDDCGGFGVCDGAVNKCVCDPGRYGYRCEFNFATSCGHVRLDERFDTIFPSIRRVASEYVRLPSQAISYHRPIFYNNETQDVLLFIGMRWAITHLVTGLNYTSINELEAAQQSFHAKDILSLDLVSTAVPYQSPDDRRGSPNAIDWIVISNQGPLSNVRITFPANPVNFLCAVCNNFNNRCNFDNPCEAGNCVCQNGATGTLCQVVPTGNGRCNTYFNTPAFLYDGGDCCEATCVSAAHRCGLNHVGNLETFVIGFPFCKDPAIMAGCTHPSHPCYIPSSQPIRPLTTETMQPLLSANGRILVMAEPLLSTVRVFDAVDDHWVQRGSRIQGNPLTALGSVVAIASKPASVVARISGQTPAYVAAYDPIGSLVRVFSWGPRDSDWIELPKISIPPTTDIQLRVGVNGIDQLNGNLTVLVEADDVLTMYTGPLLNFSAWQVTDFGNSTLSALSVDGGIIAKVEGNRTVTISQLFLNSRTDTFALPGFADTDVILGLSVYFSVSPFLHTIGLGIVTGRNTTGKVQEVTVGFYEISLSEGRLLANGPIVTTAMQDVAGVLFSSDGASLMVVDNVGSAYSLHAMTFKPEVSQLTAFAAVRTATIPSSPAARLIPGFSSLQVSLSDRGGTIVDGTSGLANLYSVREVCTDPNTTSFVLSTTTSYGTGWWSLHTHENFNGFVVLRTLGECRYCTDGTSRFSFFSLLSEEVCVPRIWRGCLAIFYIGQFQVPTSGFAAIMIDGETVDFLGSVEGPYHDSQTFYNAGRPQCVYEQKQCQRMGDGHFAFAFNTTDIATPIIWSLTSNTYSDSGTIQQARLGDSILELCIPENSCYTFMAGANTFSATNTNTTWGTFGLFFRGNAVERGALQLGSNLTVSLGQC